MEPLDIKEYICELFKAHEVPFHTENEWIVPYGEFPAIRATWFQKEAIGVFEVEVLLDSGRIINECFAGFGVGKAGIINGLENFCANSFHVLLSAFWKKHEPEQVKTDNWLINGVKYNVYIGNLGTRTTNGVEASIPESLAESLEKAVKSETLESEISWFRIFFCSVSGEFTFEALKENEIWEKGISMLSTQPWEKTEGYYSVRNFIVLRKA
ncbi:hypothetical protein BS333_17000 [Vibrio azureus]|uniref:Uncharacterized protein n=1 Tax=Vibrio azureus NBRC 104587 TaxID=1219077 RepID=U3C8I3_9VIBR|nr:DUF6348 family protein [Vibrio azureus]AUI88070.1 hypothetical protein BS333_17000 [Vibrio azureus]GAD77679.1 hypothetical protein VAZ01S_085_00260 [Vibrio azureus NBRC 104587]